MIPDTGSAVIDDILR